MMWLFPATKRVHLTHRKTQNPKAAGVVRTRPSTQSCKPCPIYTTRCRCYKGSQLCTTLCGCTNCENPYGSKPPPSHGDKRTRRKHDLQMDIPSSKRVAQERGELMSQAIWSSFEFIVLRYAIHFSKKTKTLSLSCTMNWCNTQPLHIVFLLYHQTLCSGRKAYVRS